MKFDILQLKEGPIKYDVDESPSDLDLNVDGITFGKKVTGKIVISLFGKTILVRGQIMGIAVLECIRCLEKFPYNINAEVNLVYENDQDLLKIPKEFNPEEDVIFYYDGKTLDPSQELRDSLLLELPSFPLCSESCLGLCPVCGTNRNNNTCSCERKEVKTSEAIPNWKQQLHNLKRKS